MQQHERKKNIKTQRRICTSKSKVKGSRRRSPYESLFGNRQSLQGRKLVECSSRLHTTCSRTSVAVVVVAFLHSTFHSLSHARRLLMDFRVFNLTSFWLCSRRLSSGPHRRYAHFFLLLRRVGSEFAISRV